MRLLAVTFAGTLAANVMTVLVVAAAIIAVRSSTYPRPTLSTVLQALTMLVAGVAGVVLFTYAVRQSRRSGSRVFMAAKIIRPVSRCAPAVPLDSAWRWLDHQTVTSGSAPTGPEPPKRLGPGGLPWSITWSLWALAALSTGFGLLEQNVLLIAAAALVVGLWSANWANHAYLRRRARRRVEALRRSEQSRGTFPD
jgi:hypothetical protein